MFVLVPRVRYNVENSQMIYILKLNEISNTVMLNRSLLKCFTFGKSVSSYGRLTSHNTQRRGLFKATMWVQRKNGSAAQVTWVLHQDRSGRKSGLCSPLLLRDKPLDVLAGSNSSVSIGGKTVIGYITLPRLGSHCREGCLFRLTIGTLDDPLR